MYLAILEMVGNDFELATGLRPSSPYIQPNDVEDLLLITPSTHYLKNNYNFFLYFFIKADILLTADLDRTCKHFLRPALYLLENGGICS